MAQVVVPAEGSSAKGQQGGKHWGCWDFRTLGICLCCLLVVAGIVIAVLWFVGVLHSTDSACMQGGDLRFGIGNSDKKDMGWVCCDNDRLAEPSGWFQSTRFEAALRTSNGTVTFYDASCGLPLYTAPIGRSLDDFLKESNHHGWPSFRAAEVLRDNVKVHGGGEVVSSCGTHLGHDLPDGTGERHCVNLLCVAGGPA